MASTASTMKTESTALSGLPAPFLDAMRKLFDIMDCDRVGWIHIDGKSVTKPGPPHPDPDPDPEPHLTSPESRLERSNAKMFNLITHFSPPDIAHRWQSQEANNPGLPKNVVQNLRKVMNKEGRLSFERFCAGLKISILRHEAERNKVDKRNKVNNASLTRLREISPLSLAFSRHVRMLMHEAQSGNHRTCCKRVVPRFRELAPCGQRKSGCGIHAT